MRMRQRDRERMRWRVSCVCVCARAHTRARGHHRCARICVCRARIACQRSLNAGRVRSSAVCRAASSTATCGGRPLLLLIIIITKTAGGRSGRLVHRRLRAKSPGRVRARGACVFLCAGDERGGEAAGGNRLSVVSVSPGRPLSLLLIIKITKTASGGRSGGRKPGPEPGGAGVAWRSPS